MTSLDFEKLRIRPATHADCDGIKAIDRDIYFGTDYFLYYFHQDVSREDIPIVAEIEGRIVAYKCGHVIDDGDAIVMSEARVLEELQGKGMMGIMSAALFKEATARFPNLRRMLWASGMPEMSRKHMNKFNDGSMIIRNAETLLTDYKKLKAVSESKTFLKLEEKYQVNSVKAIPKCEALKLLTEEICFLDYAPFRPMMNWQPRGWHRSTLAKQLQIADLLISRCPSSKKITGFSLLTSVDVDHGMRFSFDLYCKKSQSSEDLVISHLLSGIRHVVSIYPTREICIYFHYPAEINDKNIQKFMSTKLDIVPNTKGQLISVLVDVAIPRNIPSQSKL